MRRAANDHGQRPGHLRLALVILEGYIYLALVVAVFAAALVFLVWGVLTRRPFIALAALFVGVPVAATTARTLRALWFFYPEPDAIPLRQGLGGHLLRDVHEIAARVGAPRIDRVMVTHEYNASALQVPRAVVFWPTNTLLIGYPLLATLPLEQIRAVITHELAHITHAHGRLTGWVHRTQLSWARLLDTLERRQSVPAHVWLLFRYYVPRLRAHAAAVSRGHELLADRLTAEVVGSGVTAQTLLTIEIGQYLLSERFWPRIDRRVEDDPNPPFPFAQLGPDLWTGVEDTARVLDSVLEADLTAETHPSLRDRLAALAEQPRWPAPVAITAAAHYFGSQQQDLAAALDRRWQDAHGDEWRRRHQAIQLRRTRLAELRAISSPTPQQTFEQGLLTEEDGREEAALEIYRSAFRDGHPAAGLAAGRILLARDDASGIELIDTAMDADPALVEDGCPVVVEFLQRRGRLVDAYRYQRRMTVARTKASMARTVTPA